MSNSPETTERLANAASEARTASWHRAAFGKAVAVAWVVNVTLLVAAVGWIFGDGRSLHTIEFVWSMNRKALVDPAFVVRGSSWSLWSIVVVQVGAAFAAVTFVGMLAGLFLGSPRFRSLRAWLGFSAVACAWLGLLATWPEIYWSGQQRRLVPELPAVAEFARELAANWPKEDGDMPATGPFLAYPRGNPATMMMLTTTRIPGTDLPFSAVERSADGALRFELSGSEAGAWLEWRPDGRPPKSFVGGLETRYQLVRSSRLSPEWILARYLATGIE